MSASPSPTAAKMNLLSGDQATWRAMNVRRSPKSVTACMGPPVVDRSQRFVPKVSFNVSASHLPSGERTGEDLAKRERDGQKWPRVDARAPSPDARRGFHSPTSRLRALRAWRSRAWLTIRRDRGTIRNLSAHFNRGGICGGHLQNAPRRAPRVASHVDIVDPTAVG